jgi:hypothetical protein
MSSKPSSDPLSVVIRHRADEWEHVCARGFDCILVSDFNFLIPPRRHPILTSRPTTALINSTFKLRALSLPALNVSRRPRPKELGNTLHLRVVVISQHTLLRAMSEIRPSAADHDSVVWRWHLVVVVLTIANISKVVPDRFTNDKTHVDGTIPMLSSGALHEPSGGFDRSHSTALR